MLQNIRAQSAGFPKKRVEGLKKNYYCGSLKICLVLG